MSETEPRRDYYRAARELLPEMDEEMREKVEALLEQAEQGVKIDNLIVDIITDDDKLRRRLREMMGKDFERTLGGYQPIGGNPNPPPAQEYVCPEPDHEFSKWISRIGEDPGYCPKHTDKRLILASEKRGK